MYGISAEFDCTRPQCELDQSGYRCFAFLLRHDARTQGYRRSVTVRAQGRHVPGRALARRGAASIEGGVRSQDANSLHRHLRRGLRVSEVVAEAHFAPSRTMSLLRPSRRDQEVAGHDEAGLASEPWIASLRSQ